MSKLQSQLERFSEVVDDLNGIQRMNLDGKLSPQAIDVIDLASHKISAVRQELSTPTEFLTTTRMPVVSADLEVFERFKDNGYGLVSSTWGVSASGRIVKGKIYNVDSSKIESLTLLSQLEEVTLERIAGVDCRPLKRLEKLRSLSMSDARSVDYGFLKDLPALTEFHSHFSQDTSPVSVVSGLVNLEKLTLTNLECCDISFIEMFTKLVHLEYSCSTNSNLDFLKCLQALESLCMRGPQPSDYSFLLEMPALKRLTIYPSLCFNGEARRSDQWKKDRDGVIQLLKDRNVEITLI